MRIIPGRVSGRTKMSRNNQSQSRVKQGSHKYTWVISEVLQTVRFLFKNEFILQNAFTGLQHNLHCALSQRSNVLESLVFLSGRLRC
jgi:hypothetical protein